MGKLVQHIKMDMPGIPKQGLYCYSEASFEANQAMQEPLEKLYKYENQPDMREKITEYIGELDNEIERCHHLAEQNMNDEVTTVAEMMVVRVQPLNELKNDLQSTFDELI